MLKTDYECKSLKPIHAIFKVLIMDFNFQACLTVHILISYTHFITRLLASCICKVFCFNQSGIQKLELLSYFNQIVTSPYMMEDIAATHLYLAAPQYYHISNTEYIIEFLDGKMQCIIPVKKKCTMLQKCNTKGGTCLGQFAFTTQTDMENQIREFSYGLKNCLNLTKVKKKSEFDIINFNQYLQSLNELTFDQIRVSMSFRNTRSNTQKDQVSSTFWFRS